MAPSERSVYPTGPPPNEIVVDCNWTSGMKICLLYIGFMSKNAY